MVGFGGLGDVLNGELDACNSDQRCYSLGAHNPNLSTGPFPIHPRFVHLVDLPLRPSINGSGLVLLHHARMSYYRHISLLQSHCESYGASIWSYKSAGAIGDVILYATLNPGPYKEECSGNLLTALNPSFPRNNYGH